MTYLLIAPSGTVTALPSDTSFDDIRKMVGGWVEVVSTVDEVAGTRLNAYVDEEARLKKNIEPNPVASAIFSRSLLGPVVLTGLYDAVTETDSGLSETQVTHIRGVAARA